MEDPMENENFNQKKFERVKRVLMINGIFLAISVPAAVFMAIYYPFQFGLTLEAWNEFREAIHGLSGACSILIVMGMPLMPVAVWFGSEPGERLEPIVELACALSLLAGIYYLISLLFS
jgi:hypothetical protein